jgi:hypothetical protein
MLDEDMDELPLLDQPADIQFPRARLFAQLCNGETLEARVRQTLRERDLGLADDGGALGRHFRDADVGSRGLMELSTTVRGRSGCRGSWRGLIYRATRSQSQ